MKFPRSARLAPLALLTPLAGAQGTWFVEATDAWGITYEHPPAFGTYAMSGGVGLLDLDGDGDDDLVCIGGSNVQTVYEKRATTFVDRTLDANLATPGGNGMGVSGADFDQDGDVDVYVTINGTNRLFRNEGDFAFAEVGATLGVDDGLWGSGSSWADWDLDGDLDLYAANYIQVLAFPYHRGAPNRLYLNQGHGAAPFVDVAAALGVDSTGVFGPLDDPSLALLVGPPPLGLPTAGCTLSVNSLDFDEDGDPDLMIGNDLGEFVLGDQVFRNDVSAGTGLAFTDLTAATGFAARRLHNMGINACDYDRDGDWDLYFSNLGDNKLLRDDGGSYTEVTAAAGPLEGSHPTGLLVNSWGVAWCDFDLDGWEDLFVANGFIASATFLANPFEAVDSLWRNLGDGTFTRLPAATSGADGIGVGRGVALTDVDEDGRMDLFVLNNGSYPVNPEKRSRLYVNTCADHGAWLTLRLHGRRSNREGIGARLEARDGDQVWKRQCLANPAYLSSTTRKVHFGFGATKRVDLTVHWPAGTVQRLPGLDANRHLELREPLVTLSGLEAKRTGGTLAASLFLENHGERAVDAIVHVLGEAIGRPGSTAAATWPIVRLAPGERRLVVGEVALPVGAATERERLTAHVWAKGGLDGAAVPVAVR